MRISIVYHIILPAIFLTILFIAFDCGGLDLWCSDQFYVGQQGGWHYKHSWWAEQVIHRGGRYFIVSIVAACLFVVAESWAATSQLKCYRRAALYIILCIALSTGTVALGKATINRHCPWDYSRYGGEVPYCDLLSPPNPAYPQGHGFPAGHASGGFSLVSFYFIFYGRRPRMARIALIASLCLGTVFTFGQLVRGAHFISHSIVTVALCWFISMFLYSTIFKRNLFAALDGTEKSSHEQMS